MKTDYQLYLFDFDYTLADSSTGITLCFHKTLADCGLPDVPDADIHATIGLTMHEAIFILTGKSDRAWQEDFLKRYRVHANEHMTPNTHFYPDTLPLLRRLKAHHKKIGIISTKTKRRILEKFERDGVSDLLDIVIGCDEVEACKPSPEGLLLAMEHFGTAADETLYTGDNIVDAKAAEAANVPFLAVTTGATGVEAFRRFPHITIAASLREVPVRQR
ncbi:HAD-IA family hydrolase [Selenomonas sp. TAMA-11512]|uniref:HAD family hydrolase n=1 Tax=Selenomonas sp. TAMA-11512 TaxID=3095337 RepID=UPI003086552B|nr:HAD-IA family hydrolase [Selenomonas sp. TAMA-11512]